MHKLAFYTYATGIQLNKTQLNDRLPTNLLISSSSFLIFPARDLGDIIGLDDVGKLLAWV